MTRLGHRTRTRARSEGSVALVEWAAKGREWGFGSTEWVVMTGAGYRGHLRAVVATSAAPYGYTLTLRTARGGHISRCTRAPSALDAVLMLAGAVVGSVLSGPMRSRASTGFWRRATVPKCGSGAACTCRRPDRALHSSRSLRAACMVTSCACGRVHGDHDVPARHRRPVLVRDPPRACGRVDRPGWRRTSAEGFTYFA
jgi:hypothetical protein